MEAKICPKCNKEAKRMTGKVCHNCYRRFIWKRKELTCKDCGENKILHAKGLCVRCYMNTFRLDYNKAYNHKKRYGLDIITYKEITKECKICGFSNFVDLHHLDHNRFNNKRENLIGLCPNHHQMLHTIEHHDKVIIMLKEKGVEA